MIVPVGRHFFEGRSGRFFVIHTPCQDFFVLFPLSHGIQFQAVLKEAFSDLLVQLSSGRLFLVHRQIDSPHCLDAPVYFRVHIAIHYFHVRMKIIDVQRLFLHLFLKQEVQLLVPVEYRLATWDRIDLACELFHHKLHTASIIFKPIQLFSAPF